MTACTVPPALPPGGVIGVAAPSGPVDAARLANGLALLHGAGFEVALAPGLLERRAYLAGDDRARAADLRALLADPGVDAVICARGGYGAMRLLAYCDFAALRRSPKALAGFSDATALHLAFAAQGLVSFHGPMLECRASEAAAANLDELLRVLRGEPALGPSGRAERAPQRICPGRARGAVVGGNLTLVAASLGTPWEIDATGRLLLLEDVGEPPYRLDRYLTQLEAAGKLAAAAGFLIGELAGCEGAPGDPAPLQVFAERLQPLGRPCLADLPFGHGARKRTLPLGVQAELDADAGCLRLLQPATA